MTPPRRRSGPALDPDLKLTEYLRAYIVYILCGIINKWRVAKAEIRAFIARRVDGYIDAREGSAGRRSLLSIPAEQLSFIDRVHKATLSTVLAAPDFYYRLALRRLDRLVPRAESDQGERSGLAVAIGSLGAGGAERQMVMLMRGLLARAMTQVEVICRSLDSPDLSFFLPILTADGVTVKRLDDYASGPIDPVIRAAVKKLPAALQRALPYVAAWTTRRSELVHLWMDETNIMAGIAAVLTGVPRIVLSQRSLPPLNYTFHKSYMRESYRWLARQPAVIMVNNSQAGATAYEQWLGLPAGTIRVIRNGFEFPDELLQRYRDGRGNYRAQLGIPADAPLIGGVLRFSEEKRPLLWLDIAAQVRRHLPEARFLLIGDGVLRAKVIERANCEDLTGAIYLPGVEREPLAAMADMDLLLLTSRAEGLPNVLVEAQAVGTPVVTTNVGGAPETVQHGRTGWVLADDVAEHAALKIVELLRDRAWREKARQEAPEFVQETFGLDQAIDETIALYLTHPAVKIEKHR